MDVQRALADSYLFSDLSYGQIEALTSGAQVKEYAGGEPVVRQFDKGHDLMLVLEGSVLVKSFRDEVLAELGQGSILGEISLIDDAPRSATVVAKGRARVASLPADQVRQALEDDVVLKATVLERLAKVLCQRLRASNIALEGGLGPRR